MPLLPAKEMADRRSSREVSRKHLEKARSPSLVMGVRGEMLQKRREKVDAGSIPQNHNVKEKTCPPDQLRGLTQDIQRPVKTEARLAGVKKHKTEAHIAGEKKHTEGNASFPTKRTTPLLKARTEGLILQKHNAKEKTCPRDQLRGHTQGIKRPVKTESPPLAGEMSQKRTDKADTVSTPQKHSAKEKTRPPDQLRGHTQGIHRPVKTEARMSQKRREKVDTGSIPQKHNAMEKTRPPDQLRRHTQGIQRPVKTEARLAGEKKHTKVNTSFPTKRTTPQLRTRTSSRCSNACTSRPMDAHGHGNTAAIQEQREESAAVKVDEDVAEIIQKLNKLGLGEDISFEEYYGYLEKLPLDPRVDTSNKVDLIGRFRMDLRHAVYRIRSYKLLKNESKNELCRLELKECPMDILDKDEFPNDFLVKMQYFSFFQKKGVLDWFFDPDLPAGLNDYQRLVPHDHGNWEYASWCAYRSYFHSYEMQHEYIKYFETLLGELEWLKDCLPRKFSSLTINKIRTRGIYQATKIATRFSNITPHLARIGFDDCFTYMTIEATWCNRSDDLYFEIWKRVTPQKKSFRDALKEVYELNKCPSLQESMKYAIEDNCSVMKRAFLRCTAGAGITKEVPVDKAQELIAEAVKNQSIQPKFYDGYIRKKIEIAKPIGLITVD